MSNSKYQEALDRLCKNDYFDEKGNCNYDQIVMDRILLQELVDKATPKKPVRVCCEPEEEWDNEEELYNCPNCGEPLPYNFDYDYPIKNKCCLECQQVLDWSDEDDR